MSFLVAATEAMASAGSELTALGATIGAATAVAATPTIGLAAAAADEVSA